MLNWLFSKKDKTKPIKLMEFNKIGKLVNIGTQAAICPHCQNKFIKMPSRKIKCKNCNNFVHSRTRPSDKAKVLLKPNDLIFLEKQWQIHHQRTELDAELSYLKQGKTKSLFDEFEKRFKKQLKRKPNSSELLFQYYTNQIGHLAQNGKWGLYRNNRASLGRLFLKHQNYHEALKYFSIMLLLDANDLHRTHKNPIIEAHIKKLKSRRKYKESTLAGGAIALFLDAADGANIALENLNKYFYEYCNDLHEQLDLPLSLSKAWTIVSQAISDQQ